MIKMPAILFLLLLSFTGIAQRVIKGIVVNEATGTPIPGSSIFISNTSKGTVSDASGQFALYDVPSGKYELVISSIGYETVVHPFSDVNLPLQLRVQLKIKVKELKNVTVEPFVEEGWDKWGKVFMENFIGHTENALRCKIKNEKAIRFRYFKKSRRLIAFSDEPLRIENKALGYTINYQLEEFEVNYLQNTTLFTGYPHYEEFEKDKKKWQRKREEAYRGSTMHFFRSLYVDSLKENGFEVRRMQKIPNLEKERVKAIYKPYRSMAMGGGMTIVTDGGSEGFHPDSVAYYKRILRQDDFTDHYAKDILTSDSLVISEDAGQKLFYFTNYLSVTYKNEVEANGYLIYIKHTARKPAFQRSLFFLPESIPIWVEKSGSFYNPRDIYSMGYWGWSDKLGDSVPLDYEPEK